MSGRLPAAVAHLVAASLAMAFAWQMFNSPHAKTGLLFAAPGAVLLGAHFLADAALAGGNLSARRIFGRTVLDAVLATGGIFIFALFLPVPARADGNEVVAMLAMLSMCIVFTAIVVAIPVAAIYLLFRLWRHFFPRKPADHARLNEAGLVLLALAALAALSMEAVPGGYDFAREDEARATIEVAAPPEAVRAAIAKASSPDLHMPPLLQFLPKITGVVDEGDAIGARRIVHFKGREGEGELVLTVATRTPETMTWTVTSDSTPMGQWAALRSVSYHVVATGAGANLEVTGRYRRLLAPAWFFKPYMRAAIGSGMQVLAQDKHDRALAIAGR